MMEHEGRWTLIGLVRPFHASWARYQLKRQDVPTSASRPRLKGSSSSRHTLVLFQVSAGYSCAKRGQPGIYHRVARTSDWISKSINE